MNMKRMRGRNHRPNGGGGGGGGSTSGGFRNQQNGIPLNRNHVFDSSGPEMRVRGTAQQLYDKYQQMARDASSNGDRVTGEAYYQHAEHYFRIIAAINQAQGQPNQPVAAQQNGQGQERGNYQPQNNGERGNYQPQNNGGQNQERGDYQRRDHNSGNNNNGNGEQNELPMETRQEPRPQENRQQENRQQEPRRYEQRPYEPRQKPEFQRQDREPRFRPEPVVDARIDISSALEAELAAATAELPGFGEQPAVQPVAQPVLQPVAAPEPRAIPIISDAPPAAKAAPAVTKPVAVSPPAAEEAAVIAPRVPKPRGRPRLVKPVAEEAKNED